VKSHSIAITLVIAASCTPSGTAAKLSRHVFEQVHFGNIKVELCLYTESDDEAKVAAADAFAYIKVLSAMMSDYAFEPPSPLNSIAAKAPEPVVVPPELFRALTRAVAMHEITQGAFDITAKPYVQLWRTSRKLGELPPPARLRRAKRFVDIQALVLDEVASTATLAKAGMWLDLGGLAKGLIGDEVVQRLRTRGVPICRYHAGGDMVFGDPPPGETGWTVTVPDFMVEGDVEGESGAEVPLSFKTSNAAVSVSGDVFRYVDIDGVRYSHVIDPRTGLGVTECRITCVRGRRGVDTDPLATAGLLLDVDAWRAALAKVPGCRGDVAPVHADIEPQSSAGSSGREE
jgi:thiamine biosynthesis lipoprotein